MEFLRVECPMSVARVATNKFMLHFAPCNYLKNISSDLVSTAVNFMSLFSNLISPKPTHKIPFTPDQIRKKQLLVPGLLLSHGIKEFNQKNYEQAEKHLTEYLKHFPDNYQAKSLLLDVYSNPQSKITGDTIEKALLLQKQLFSVNKDVQLEIQLAEILCKAAESGFIPSAYQDISGLILAIIEISKLTKKTAKFFELFTRLMQLSLHFTTDKVIAEFSQIANQKESFQYPALHLNFMNIIKDQQLVLYVSSNLEIFRDDKDWLQKAYLSVKPNRGNQVLALTIKAELTRIAIKDRWFVTDSINEFEGEIAGLELTGDLHNLLSIRQEMTAKLELFKALHGIQAGLNSPDEIKQVIESLSFSIEYVPPKPEYRVVDCIHTLYYLLLAVDCEAIFKNELVYNDKLKYDIKSGITTCKWDPKASKDLYELFQKYNYFETVLDSISANPWNLKTFVDIAFFNFLTGNLKKWLQKLFPTIPLRYQPNSPRKNQVDMKKTVSIADLESFFALLLLERQATILKVHEPQTFPQLLLCCLTSTWEPTLIACNFWKYVVATQGTDITGNILYKNLFNIKTFPPLLNEIRGNTQHVMYGYLGMFYHDLHIYYSQNYAKSALTFLELCKLSQPHVKFQLFSPIIKAFPEIFNLPKTEDAKARLKEQLQEVVEPVKFSPQTSHCMVEAESFSFGQSTISNISSTSEKPSPKPSPYPTFEYSEDEDDISLKNHPTPNKSLLSNMFVIQTPSAVKWNDIGINLDSVDRRQRLLKNLEKLKT
ncbi:hypothetical protein HDV06_004576 [Boothiomyces sp. JEL0866]|nr:hypothetical protein HDV06_004576 [Boothiomyces sp. JEL0866]